MLETLAYISLQILLQLLCYLLILKETNNTSTNNTKVASKYFDITHYTRYDNFVLLGNLNFEPLEIELIDFYQL